MKKPTKKPRTWKQPPSRIWHIQLPDGALGAGHFTSGREAIRVARDWERAGFGRHRAIEYYRGTITEDKKGKK